jgi:glycine cleavage system protein P-like pyridoxal-binding family
MLLQVELILNALGVDAVHNNLHKTWSIPHGGGGPGDAIVAVSERSIRLSTRSSSN